MLRRDLNYLRIFLLDLWNLSCLYWLSTFDLFVWKVFSQKNKKKFKLVIFKQQNFKTTTKFQNLYFKFYSDYKNKFYLFFDS